MIWGIFTHIWNWRTPSPDVATGPISCSVFESSFISRAGEVQKQRIYLSLRLQISLTAESMKTGDHQSLPFMT
jgi:hypothetical protein